MLNRLKCLLGTHEERWHWRERKAPSYAANQKDLATRVYDVFDLACKHCGKVFVKGVKKLNSTDGRMEYPQSIVTKDSP